jgi:hypothetical protein
VVALALTPVLALATTALAPVGCLALAFALATAVVALATTVVALATAAVALATAIVALATTASVVASATVVIAVVASATTTVVTLALAKIIVPRACITLPAIVLSSTFHGWDVQRPAWTAQLDAQTSGCQHGASTEEFRVDRNCAVQVKYSSTLPPGSCVCIVRTYPLNAGAKLPASNVILYLISSVIS